MLLYTAMLWGCLLIAANSPKEGGSENMLSGAGRPTPDPSHAWEGRKILWVIGGTPSFVLRKPPDKGFPCQSLLHLVRD